MCEEGGVHGRGGKGRAQLSIDPATIGPVETSAERPQNVALAERRENVHRTY